MLPCTLKLCVFMTICVLPPAWNGTPSSGHHNLIPSHSKVNASLLSSGNRADCHWSLRGMCYCFVQNIFLLFWTNLYRGSGGLMHLFPNGNRLFLNGMEKAHHYIAWASVKFHVKYTTFPKCLFMSVFRRVAPLLQLEAWNWRENQ